MSFENAVRAPGARTLYAQVTRANGRRERRRLVSYSSPNPIRDCFVHLLMKFGVL
jgi:hypothetical protein